MSEILNDIHWHEGLFLRPHHLQMQQRSLAQRHAFARALTMTHPYGLLEARLSREALENRVVQFDRLTAVLPGGEIVSYPDNVELSALDIRGTFQARQSFTILLGLPRWYPDRANTLTPAEAEQARVKKIYRLSERECADENTGDNRQPIGMRKLNAFLLLEDDENRNDLDVLPVTRIVHGSGDRVGQPEEDMTFMPPCLVVEGSPVLGTLLRDLASQVEAARRQLAEQMSRAQIARKETAGSKEIDQFLRLRSLSRFSGRLAAIQPVRRITPFALYVELRDFYGELIALSPDRGMEVIPEYNHDQPAAAFQFLYSRIVDMLKPVGETGYLSVKLERDRDGFVAPLTAEHLNRPTEYYIGIETRMEVRDLATMAESIDKFKVMSKSMLARPVWGVPVTMERMPSFVLPAQAGLFYFRLAREKSAMWNKIREEGAIGVRWPDWEKSDFRVTLYMLVPRGEVRT